MERHPQGAPGEDRPVVVEMTVTEAARGQPELAVAVAVAGVRCTELRILMPAGPQLHSAVVDGCCLMRRADSKPHWGPEGAVEGRDEWSTCNG